MLDEIFQEASEIMQDGLNSVMLHPSVVLLNIIVFLIMLFFVRRFLWKNITEFLDKRQNALTEEFDKASLERKNAQEMEQKAISEYGKMKAETDDLKTKLTQEAYKQQEKLVEAAKKEAKNRLEQASKDIENEIAKANEEIRQSIKEIAFAAAEKIVRREIDQEQHSDIIDELIHERDDLKHE
ncbi:MAG: F0F1 ATP synthase subunit B [Acholeplasmataceae bacterium]